MPEPRHLRNAPITEAVIDYRVRARRSFEPQGLELLRSRLVDRFPEVQEARETRVTFQLSLPDVKPAAVEVLGLHGYRFLSRDRKLVAQFRIDGFTLNRLSPYTSWDELSPIARDLWSAYCAVAAPESVTRIALRYINHISLPGEPGDFERFLRAAPRIPPELPQVISEFFVRTTIHEADSQLSAHVTQVLQSYAGTRKVKLILDIDAYHDGLWSPEAPDLRGSFEQLRRFKNAVFFNYVTNETLRQYE